MTPECETVRALTIDAGEDCFGCTSLGHRAVFLGESWRKWFLPCWEQRSDGRGHARVARHCQRVIFFVVDYSLAKPSSQSDDWHSDDSLERRPKDTKRRLIHDGDDDSNPEHVQKNEERRKGGVGWCVCDSGGSTVLVGRQVKE